MGRRGIKNSPSGPTQASAAPCDSLYESAARRFVAIESKMLDLAAAACDFSLM